MHLFEENRNSEFDLKIRDTILGQVDARIEHAVLPALLLEETSLRLGRFSLVFRV